MAVIALRGWHPALSRHEAIAMFPESNIQRTTSRRLLIGEGESNWERADKLSGTECVLIGGGISKWVSIDQLISEIQFEKRQNMAIVCWRHEGKLPVSTKEIEVRLGANFSNMGATMNLENPEVRFGVILDASSGLVAWGWMIGQGPGTHGWSSMNANKRPYFKPISLEPRLARAIVNIAAGIDDGVVIDPMCGTGGFLIEAGLSGRHSIGIDIDPEMVNGAKENLQWANVEGEVFVGDAANYCFPKKISGIVIDPPYGRNSQPSENRVFAKILSHITTNSACKSLVIVLPNSSGIEDLDEDIDCGIEIPGFDVKSCLGIPIHKSLCRKVIIAKR